MLSACGQTPGDWTMNYLWPPWVSDPASQWPLAAQNPRHTHVKYAPIQKALVSSGPASWWIHGLAKPPGYLSGPGAICQIKSNTAVAKVATLSHYSATLLMETWASNRDQSFQESLIPGYPIQPYQARLQKFSRQLAGIKVSASLGAGAVLDIREARAWFPLKSPQKWSSTLRTGSWTSTGSAWTTFLGELYGSCMRSSLMARAPLLQTASSIAGSPRIFFLADIRSSPP